MIGWSFFTIFLNLFIQDLTSDLPSLSKKVSSLLFFIMPVFCHSEFVRISTSGTPCFISDMILSLSAGCTSAMAIADVQPADNDKIISLMKQGVPLVDIRTNSEWQNTGIIKNSKLLTFFDKDGKSDVKSWMNKLRKMVKKDQPIIIICRSGRRSFFYHFCK